MEPTWGRSFSAAEMHPQGTWCGPWRNYVEAGSLAALACLRNRLNELDENLAIEIREW